MSKQITKIVLTGGPSAGKTTLISRILKEFTAEQGWKVITIPETATELISGFGLGPFEGCMSMLDFQYFVIGDQLHKEELALLGAEKVPQEKVLVIYDRAIFDDRAYISQEEFEAVLAHFGTTPEEMISHYDAVLHLVTCAKGAEFAYNFGSDAENNARYEGIDIARIRDDETLAAWSIHPDRRIIDNSVDFEDKINRAIAEIYRIVGLSVPEVTKRKFLIQMPDEETLQMLGGSFISMTQTYLADTIPNVERRVRMQPGDNGAFYFYTEKQRGGEGSHWVTEKPVSEKVYNSLLREADPALSPVTKKKLRFVSGGCNMEIDVYPFSADKAVLFVYGGAQVPEGITVIQEVTGDPEYKNRRLAKKQAL